MIPAYEIDAIESLEVHDYIENNMLPYNNTRRNVSDQSKVDFTEVTRQNEAYVEDEDN